MSLFIDKRVSWLLERATGYEVSLETGIPRSTVYRFKKGIGGIPDQYYTGVRNAYRRESYSNLRDQGFSSSQAARHRGLEPVSRLVITDTFDNTVKELARGAAIERLETLGLAVNEANIKRYVPAMAKKVREGLSRSKATFEDWLDYARV